MTALPADIREQFPVLKRHVNGNPLAYLDNAATTQKPQSVIDVVTTYYQEQNANIHRGIYTLSEEATAAYEDARKTVAQFIHTRLPKEIIFTRSTTESLNALAYAWARERLSRGDEILLTEMEHHSNTIPWQQAAIKTGAKLVFADVTDDGRIDEHDFASKLSKRTKIVAITAMSNVLGTIPPVKQLIKTVRKACDAIVVVDAAQAVVHSRVDVQSLDCDFLAFSGHKMYAPMGIGVLYGKEERLEEMEPFLFGGNMINEVTKAKTTWNELPDKFEAGTPNVGGAIALAEAIRFIDAIGMDTIVEHELDVTDHALKRMADEKDITIYEPLTTENRGGVIAFNVEGIHPHDLASIVDQEGIALRSGMHCAMILMERLGVPATSRVSIGVYNTIDEIDRLMDAIEKAKKILL